MCRIFGEKERNERGAHHSNGADMIYGDRRDRGRRRFYYCNVNSIGHTHARATASDKTLSNGNLVIIIMITGITASYASMEGSSCFLGGKECDCLGRSTGDVEEPFAIIFQSLADWSIARRLTVLGRVFDGDGSSGGALSSNLNQYLFIHGSFFSLQMLGAGQPWCQCGRCALQGHRRHR